MKKITLICVAVFSCLVFSACGGTPKCDDEKVVENVKFSLAYVTANIIARNMTAEYGGAFPPDEALQNWAKNDIAVKLDNFETVGEVEVCKVNVSIEAPEFKIKDNGVVHYMADYNKDKQDGIDITFVKTQFKNFIMNDDMAILEYTKNDLTIHSVAKEQLSQELQSDLEGADRILSSQYNFDTQIAESVLNKCYADNSKKMRKLFVKNINNSGGDKLEDWAKSKLIAGKDNVIDIVEKYCKKVDDYKVMNQQLTQIMTPIKQGNMDVNLLASLNTYFILTLAKASLANDGKF